KQDLNKYSMQGLWSYISKTGQGPGKDFQYDIGEVVDVEKKSPWVLHCGKKKGTNEDVTVFACNAKNCPPDEFQLAKSSHKRLKTLRHPNIIKYLDGFESEELVYVVTEKVRPLIHVLQDEDDKDKNANLISWGIYQITSGLSFLINDGKLVHGNVNVFSIFVTIDGEWKLGGVEYVHPVANDPVAKISALTRYDPPEGIASKKQEPWSIDAWGLGCLLWEIFNGPLENASNMKKVSNIPKSLVIHYGNLVCANPRQRTNPRDFLNNAKKPGQYLNNSFITANIFLQEIQLKDIEAQKQFFGTLDKTIDDFPKDFCIHKVLPQLLNAYEFSTAGSSVLSPLFKIGLLLDDEAYEKKILPCIIKLFSSNDRSTRIHLLQQMEKFVKHLQKSVVNNQIFPCVATGFGDTLPAMREQTVKAMLLLAPKLSDKALDQLLRYFAKLQMDEQAGIRTNTTICLGKIAEHLSDQTRKKVLIPAFVRSFRDPFPPARSAGVMALLATQQYHDIREVAGRVLPALCPLTTDPEKMVRDNVFKAIKTFLEKLEDFSTNPQSPLNNEEAAVEEANGQGGSTWTGWAVSSFASRFYQQGAGAQGGTQKPGPPNQQQSKDTNSGNKPTGMTLKGKEEEKKKTMKNEKHLDSGDDSDTFKSLDSIKDALMDVREESSKTKDGNKSDSDQSDYGDWKDDGWGVQQDDAKDKHGGGGWDDTVADGWNDPSPGGWDDTGTDDWGVSEAPKKTNTTTATKKKNVDKLKSFSTANNEKTVNAAEGWGGWDESNNTMTGGWDDATNDEGGAGWDVDNFVATDNLGVESSDGWGDSFGLEENTNSGDFWDDKFKEKDKQELKKKREEDLRRKREERKAQRELKNKNRREKTVTSGGGMKLGAVKKKD
uniref:N-terminal kinase-like protein n=2 Tax=Clytia hemisphaerica TaxID=252671 RepID=A0A7M5UK70_9CNID